MACSAACSRASAAVLSEGLVSSSLCSVKGGISACISGATSSSAGGVVLRRADGKGGHDLATGLGSSRLSAPFRRVPSIRDQRVVMAVAVGAPTAPALAAADTLVSAPLPWHALALESSLDSAACSHSNQVLEEECSSSSFSDADAQKELDLARTLSQINSLAKAAMKSAEASKVLEAERLALEEEAKFFSQKSPYTDFLTREDYELLEEARKQEAAGRKGEAGTSGRTASKPRERQPSKAPAAAKRKGSKGVSKRTPVVDEHTLTRARIKTLAQVEAADARVRKKAPSETSRSGSAVESRAQQRARRREERAATRARWKERSVGAVVRAKEFVVEDSVGQMLNNAGRAKLLTPKEELECAMCIKEKIEWERVRDVLTAEAGREVGLDELAESLGMGATVFREKWMLGNQAKDLMVRSNLRLVVSVAKKYCGRNMDFTDLVQEGNMGLIKGVEKYDHTKGFRFSTYAHWWIRQAISRAVAENSRTIRLPVHMYEAITKVYRAKRLLVDQLGRPATVAEIGALCGFPPEKVTLCLQVNKPVLSTDRELSEDRPGSKLIDTLIVEDESSPALVKKAEAVESAMMNVLHTLNPKERDIIAMRYGLNGTKVRSLEEIGNIFQVTRERIRQVEAQALKKLRHPTRNLTLQEFVDQQA